MELPSTAKNKQTNKQTNKQKNSNMLFESQKLKFKFWNFLYFVN